MSGLITLTGITGFVGMRIAEQALNSGYRVRATVRKIQHGDKVRSFIEKEAPTERLEFVQADLLSDDGWEEAMNASNYVIHTASAVILGAVEDESVLFGPAVDGTRRVLEAAKRANVKKIVVTSTVLTIAGHVSDRMATPADFTPADDPRVNLYAQSKIAAEEVVLNFRADNPSGPEVVTIHPGVIIGPPLDPEEDAESISLFRGIWSGSQPAIPDLPFPMADVRDVAQIHLAAMTLAETGSSRYLVSFSTEPQKFPDIARVLRRHGNKKAPRFTIPLFVLRLLSRFNEEIRTLVKSTDGLSMRLDTSATVKDFGWEPIAFEKSVLDTAHALERN